MQMLLKCLERENNMNKVENVGVQEQQKRTDDGVYVGKKRFGNVYSWSD